MVFIILVYGSKPNKDPTANTTDELVASEIEEPNIWDYIADTYSALDIVMITETSIPKHSYLEKVAQFINLGMMVPEELITVLVKCC